LALVGERARIPAQLSKRRLIRSLQLGLGSAVFVEVRFQGGDLPLQGGVGVGRRRMPR
jgi:hypothetical protein